MALASVAAPKPYTPYVPSPGVNVTPTTTTAAPPPAVPANPFGTSTQKTIPNPQSIGDFYTGILSSDQLLKQALAGINASGVGAKAGLTAGLQRGVIGYGGVPTTALTAPGLSDALDQTTRDLASQNTSAGLSTLAKLHNAYTQSQQVSDADLAARGLLHSGAYGQHAADNLLTYNQNQDTAQSQLMDYLTGLYNGYLNQLDSLRQQSAGATSEAGNRIIQEIGAGQLSYPATVGNPAAYTTQELAKLGAPAAGPSPFSDADTGTLAHFFGQMTPQQLETLGIGHALPATTRAPSPSKRPSAVPS